MAQPTPAACSHWQDAASLASSHFSLKCSSEKASSREGSFFLSELEGNENENEQEKKCPWFSPSFQEKVGLCFEQPKPFCDSVILHGFSAAEHCQQLTCSHFGVTAEFSYWQQLKNPPSNAVLILK